MEMKGKLETTYCWTCATCARENRRVDDKHCAECGKELSDEKVLRHFKLTPEPMRLGFRT
jgi:hypothetical protein